MFETNIGGKKKSRKRQQIFFFLCAKDMKMGINKTQPSSWIQVVLWDKKHPVHQQRGPQHQELWNKENEDYITLDVGERT